MAKFYTLWVHVYNFFPLKNFLAPLSPPKKKINAGAATGQQLNLSKKESLILHFPMKIELVYILRKWLLSEWSIICSVQ